MLHKLLSNLVVGLLLTCLLSPSVFASVKPLNLSPNAKQAIHHLSADMLKNGPNPNILAIKPQLDPQDYQTVKNIGSLPDEPHYFLKDWARFIALFFTPGDLGKASQRLRIGHEKTLETLLLLEKANKEKDAKKLKRLIDLSAKNLENVGEDFDQVSQNLDRLQKARPIEAYLLKEEAFSYSAFHLKHQILLQKEEDRLKESDFLKIEQARIKHLPSVAHLVVAKSSDPALFANELSKLIAPQTGTNFSKLATLAQLRDLEIKASEKDQPSLRRAEAVLQKELEIKLTKLPLDERIKLVEKYLSFIHGNPIRQFASYDQISQNFTSKQMTVLTSALKDKAAGNLKNHLNYLNNEDLQKQFVQTLFSSFPVDLRLLFYTEVQLNPKVLAVATQTDNSKEQQKAVQLQNLMQVKALLGSQICQDFGQNPQMLAQTRFYTRNIQKPDVLDLKVAQFLSVSIQNCSQKSLETQKLVSDLKNKINSNFTSIARKSVSLNKLPTKAKAIEVFKDEGITVKAEDQQIVAEEIIEETQVIQEEVSQDNNTLEKEVETIKETAVQEHKLEPTIVEEAVEIVDEIINEDEPTEEEITQKEEEIVEQIEDAAGSGETSSLVEELPQEVQEEISHETGVPLPTVNPSPTPITASTPIPVPSTSLLPSPTPITSSTPLPATQPSPTPAPTAEPAPQPTPIDEPTLIEEVVETVNDVTPSPTPITAPVL